MDKRTGLVIVALVAVVALTLSALAAGPTLAGNGHGKGGNEPSAVLWVEPSNPFPAWGFDFAIRGSGFTADSVVHISMTPNGVTSNVLADSNGDIIFGWSTGAPGTYTFSAYQDLQGNHWSTYASVAVEVVE